MKGSRRDTQSGMVYLARGQREKSMVNITIIYINVDAEVPL